jgi:Mn-dependent DtxR family transcriptional regulator
MILGESAENYLETILILSRKTGNVRSVDIAAELGFSKPSVCVAMRNLREHGYAVTDADGLISLTEEGLKVANRVYERHLTLSNFFVQIGVSEDQAAIDACRIEHVISVETFECLKKHIKAVSKNN